MSDEPGTRFSVLLPHPRQLDVKVVAAPMAVALGCSRIDLAQRLRRSPGIPFGGLERPEADRICAALAEHGVAAVVVPDRAVAPWPRPVRVSGLSFHDDGLELHLAGTVGGGTGVRVGVEAEAYELLSAAVYLQERAAAGEGARGPGESEGADPIELLAATYRRTGVDHDPQAEVRERARRLIGVGAGARPGPSGRERGRQGAEIDDDAVAGVERLIGDEAQVQARWLVHLDLALGTGELYRIASDAFVFHCLGEARGASSVHNTLLLASLLDRRIAAAVARTPEWEALARGDPAGAVFGGAAEYEAELRWRLSAGAAGAGAAGPAAAGGVPGDPLPGGSP